MQPVLKPECANVYTELQLAQGVLLNAFYVRRSYVSEWAEMARPAAEGSLPAEGSPPAEGIRLAGGIHRLAGGILQEYVENS